MNCEALEWDWADEGEGGDFMPVFIEPQSNEVHGLPLTNGADGIRHRHVDGQQ